MLDPESISQFFTPNSRGNSEEIHKTVSENSEKLEISQIRARTNQAQAPWYTSNSFGVDGMPGIPFERGVPNPDVFYQGEDIVFDLSLVHEGKKVSLEDFDIKAIVKTNPRAHTASYSADVENGIYPQLDTPGGYELWIPSAVTQTLLPGTYLLGIQISERLGRGEGRYDRKHIILQHYFNIEYSNFSATPENTSNMLRGSTEKTWPNAPSTVTNA